MMIRRQLLLASKPQISPKHRVKDLDQLRQLLQSALKLELTMSDSRN